MGGRWYIEQLRAEQSDCKSNINFVERSQTKKTVLCFNVETAVTDVCPVHVCGPWNYQLPQLVDQVDEDVLGRRAISRTMVGGEIPLNHVTMIPASSSKQCSCHSTQSYSIAISVDAAEQWLAETCVSVTPRSREHCTECTCITSPNIFS